MPETQGSCDFEHNDCGYKLTGRWPRTTKLYNIETSRSGKYRKTVLGTKNLQACIASNLLTYVIYTGFDYIGSDDRLYTYSSGYPHWCHNYYLSII